MEQELPEVWLRGPLKNVPGLLQPVAHALLQVKEELNKMLATFPENKLWLQPAGVASVAFHLQHIPGVLDRLFTYAEGEQLNVEQLQYLSLEGKEDDNISLLQLLLHFNKQVDDTIKKLELISEETLTDFRPVGRKQFPSTVLGLIFHSAEHTMRHVGQLLVTVKVISQL